MIKAVRAVKLLPAVCLATATCWASTITTGSATPGSTFSYVGASVEKGSDLAGATATATFGDSTVITCTFTSAGTCIAAGDFQVSVTPPTSNTLSADWIVDDLRGANTSGNNNDITTLTINLIPANSSFSPCTSGGQPTVNDSCGQAKSVSSSPSGAGLPTSASVLYTNELHLVGQSFDSTEWGVITLSFTGTFRSGTNDVNAFWFKVDSDLLTGIMADAPEPATMALMGLGLLGLAFLKFRRKRA